MFDNQNHTPLDHAALVAAGVDPDTSQPRTRPVTCLWCRTTTWNLAACCDTHYEPPRRTRDRQNNNPGEIRDQVAATGHITT